MRLMVSLPVPRDRLSVVVVALEAGSVAVIVIAFSPAVMATVIVKAPLLSAVVVTDVWLLPFWARIVLLPWVRPLMSTLLPLTFVPSLGETIVSFGLAVSSTIVTGLDGELSPPGPTIVAVNTFVPLSSLTPGIVNVAVWGIATFCSMRAGFWPWSAWYSEIV